MLLIFDKVCDRDFFQYLRENDIDPIYNYEALFSSTSTVK